MKGAPTLSGMDTIAADIMSKGVMTVREDMTIEEALKILINTKITGMPVVDISGKMVGVLSEFDILQQMAEAKSLKPQAFQKRIKFTKAVESILEGTPLKELIDKFITLKLRRLPV